VTEDDAVEHLIGNEAQHTALLQVLEDSRAAGFLGPGPIEAHVQHAQVFLDAGDLTGRVMDLGSGGGLPGLVLALTRPATEFTLLDAMERRCRFLAGAIERLELGDRVEVVCGRAEELAHSPALRGRFPIVVSRSFGAPAVTAECAVGFLAGPGAQLLVSEPPSSDPQRWPADGVELLGLRLGPRVVGAGGSVQVLELHSSVSPRLPRRVGVPAKRPLF
jgi:16S rRNA (guanine527-N7)-methyltransferase